MIDCQQALSQQLAQDTAPGLLRQIGAYAVDSQIFVFVLFDPISRLAAQYVDKMPSAKTLAAFAPQAVHSGKNLLRSHRAVPGRRRPQPGTAIAARKTDESGKNGQVSIE